MRNQRWIAFLAAFVTLVGAANARADCKVGTEDTNKDGQVNWVYLENDFYRLKFAGPQERGGGCEEAIFKPTGQDLNAGASYYWRRWYLIRDYAKITPPGEPMDDNFTERTLNRGSWAYRVLADTPQEASVEFSMRMPEYEGVAWATKVVQKRRVTLKKGDALVYVEVEAVNEDSQPHGMAIEVQNGVGIQGEDFVAFLPDADGVTAALDMAPSHGSYGTVIDSFSAAWVGGIARSGTGCVYDYPYALIDTVEYYCFGSPGTLLGADTRNVTVAPGASLKLPYTFQAFRDFRSLDGSVSGLAAGVSIGNPEVFNQTVDIGSLAVGRPAPVALTLSAATSRDVTVSLAARVLPEEKSVAVGTQAANLGPAATTKLSFDYTPAKEGLHVLVFTVEQGGKPVLTFDKTFALGKASAVYSAPMPQVARVGEPDNSLLKVDRDVEPWMYQLDLSRVTPHVPWGRPWRRGATGVLLVSERDYSVMHWRELDERADLALDHILLWNRAYPKDAYRKPVLRRLELALANGNFDTVVLTNIWFDQGLTPQLRDALYRLVAEEGKGLVVVGDARYDAKKKTLVSREFELLLDWLKNAAPVTDHYLYGATPLRAANAAAWAWTKGKGRVVIVPASGRNVRDNMGGSVRRIAHIEGDPLKVPRADEYAYALLDKAILWAAHRDSILRIDFVSAWGRQARPPASAALLGMNAKQWTDEVMPRVLPESLRRAAERRDEPVTVAVNIVNAGDQPLRAFATVTVRDMWYHKAAERRAPLTLASGESVIPVVVRQALPTGAYLADVILRDADGRSMGWGSGFFEVRGDFDLKLAMDREKADYRTGDPVAAVVEITKKKETAFQGELELSAVDAWGRVAWRASRPLRLNDARTTLTVPLQDFRPVDVVHDLTATFRADGATLARDGVTFHVYPRRPRLLDEFSVSAWGGLNDRYIDRYVIGPAHEELGYAIIRGGLEAWRHHAQLSTLSRMPMIKALLRKDSQAAKTGVLKDPLRLSPEREQKLRDTLTAQAAAGLAQGIDFYFGDDERSLPGNIDQSDYTTEGFRDYLKSTYGDIAALNRQWDSAFKDFATIPPQPKRDLVTIKTEATGLRSAETKAGAADVKENPSAWFDWRRYMGHILTEQHNRMPLEALRAGNPAAGAGFLGTYGTRASGQDWFEVVKYLPMTGYYVGPEELLRSFAPQNIYGPWVGYGMTVEPSVHERLTPWLTLFQGGHWTWYWELVSEGYGYGSLNYDGTPHRAHMVLKKDEYDDIQRGLATLFFHATFTDDGIAMPYSYATDMVDGTRETAVVANAIKELGRQYTWYAHQQVEAGALRQRGVKALFLPDTSCMTDAEVAQVRAFVEAGGLLIGGYRVATRDGHGKPRGVGALDGLFGIDRAATSPEKARAQTLTFAAAAPAAPRGTSTETMCFEPGLKAAGGAAALASFADGSAAVLRRTAGKGVCWYLNAGAGNETMKTLLDAILNQAGVSRRVTVMPDDGRGDALNGSEIVYYHVPGEQALYVGALFPKAARLSPVRIQFPTLAHIHDVRTGRYLGYGTSIHDAVQQSRARVFAALPYRVQSVTIRLDRATPQTAYRPGDNVRFAVQVGADNAALGLHVIHVRVYDGAGNEVKAHCCNLVAHGGAAERAFPLAFNAAAGSWRVVAADVASGVTGLTRFDVAR